MAVLPNDLLGSIFESLFEVFECEEHYKYLERIAITLHDHTVRIVCKNWKNIFDKKGICAFCSIGPRLRIVACFDADRDPGGWESKNLFLMRRLVSRDTQRDTQYVSGDQTSHLQNNVLKSGDRIGDSIATKSRGD